MHRNFRGVREFYCRYYRLFPQGWEWPRGYGRTILWFSPDRSALPPTRTYPSTWISGEPETRLYASRRRDRSGATAVTVRCCAGMAVLPTRWHTMSPRRIASNWGRGSGVEYYARLSDPGAKNGALKLWVNGKLVGDLDGLPLIDEQARRYPLRSLVSRPVLSRRQATRSNGTILTASSCQLGMSAPWSSTGTNRRERGSTAAVIGTV